MRWYRHSPSPIAEALRRARSQMIVEWFLSWHTVPWVLAFAVFVMANVPWATAIVVSPLHGNTPNSMFAMVAAIVAIAPLLYRRVTLRPGWPVLLVPLACFGIIAGLTVTDLVTIWAIPPGSEDEFFGLWVDVRPTGWLFAAIAASFLGIVATLAEILHDRRYPLDP